MKYRPLWFLLPLLATSCLAPKWTYHECSLETGDPRPDRTRMPILTSISIQGSELVANGETLTGGYRNASLRRLPGLGYTDQRVYEFAVEPPPPGSMAVQVISPHTARIRLDDAGIRHIRVLGVRNALCADRQ
ncbi:MAG: hypothetical protein U1G08_17725 [Verrucomicrobiota bacterium]